jgi:hypothetical protein
MLTEARAEHAWLAAGSVMVQQQALRDFDQAMRNFYAGTHRRPGRRRRHQHEGFRVVNVTCQDARRLNRRWGQVKVPKVGGSGSAGPARRLGRSPTGSRWTGQGVGTSSSR